MRFGVADRSVVVQPLALRERVSISEAPAVLLFDLLGASFRAGDHREGLDAGLLYEPAERQLCPPSALDRMGGPAATIALEVHAAILRPPHAACQVCKPLAFILTRRMHNRQDVAMADETTWHNQGALEVAINLTRRKMTQAQLAVELTRDPSWVSRLIHDGKEPDLTTAIWFRDQWGIDPASFLIPANPDQAEVESAPTGTDG